MMGYGFGMGYGWIFMLVFWVLLVAGVVWAVTRLAPRSDQDAGRVSRRESPMETLQRRLASGEIEPEEYLRIRDQLSAPPRNGGE